MSEGLNPFIGDSAFFNGGKEVLCTGYQRNSYFISEIKNISAKLLFSYLTT
ncbi:hypothetical protein ATG71_1898 [Bacillus sp. es.034]|nr:hypothetical protein ATG71_1898 [Bacillus sp. es.034]